MYDELESFIYEYLFEGCKDVKKIRLEMTNYLGDKETFEYEWNSREY